MMSPSPPTPFTFDTVFDASGEIEDPRAHDRPRHSDEAMEQARAMAHAEGEAAGRQAAFSALEQSVADTLAKVADTLGALDGRHRAALEEIRADAARLAQQLAAKLAPALIRRAPAEEILALAAECLALMPMEPRIVLRVEEAMVEEIGGRIDEVAKRAGFSGSVVLLGEPALGSGECRVEWPDGGTERDPRALVAEIEDIVERHCATWSQKGARGIAEAPSYEESSS